MPTERKERCDMPLLDRLDDAAMVLASAPLEMDQPAGDALSADCEEAATEIRRLREENHIAREGLERIAPLDITLDAPMGDEARLELACQIATDTLKRMEDVG